MILYPVTMCPKVDAVNLPMQDIDADKIWLEIYMIIIPLTSTKTWSNLQNSIAWSEAPVLESNACSVPNLICG